MNGQEIYIGSERRTSESTIYHANIPLQNPLQGTYKLKEARFPNSAYNIHSNNNTVITSLGTGTVSPGFYTSSSLPSALQTALGGTFTVTFNSITNKITIANSNSFTITGGTMLNVLGMQVTSVAATSVEGTGLFNLSYDLLNFYVCINGVQNITSVAGGPYATFIIPMDVNTCEIMTYIPDSLCVITFQPTSNSRFLTSSMFDFII